MFDIISWSVLLWSQPQMFCPWFHLNLLCLPTRRVTDLSLSTDGGTVPLPVMPSLRPLALPPAAPCDPCTPPPCSPASLHGAPSPGRHPSLSPPPPTRSSPSSPLPLAVSPHSHPGGGPSSALHSGESSRLALRGTLGFTNCVRPRDTSVINSERRTRGKKCTTAAQGSEWLMLSISEIWNKLALWYDQNCGCLHPKKRSEVQERVSRLN